MNKNAVMIMNQLFLYNTAIKRLPLPPFSHDNIWTFWFYFTFNCLHTIVIHYILLRVFIFYFCNKKNSSIKQWSFRISTTACKMYDLCRTMNNYFNVCNISQHLLVWILNDSTSVLWQLSIMQQLHTHTHCIFYRVYIKEALWKFERIYF